MFCQPLAGLLRIIFPALVWALVAALPAAAQQKVDLELILMVDGSGSVDDDEFILQRLGYARALRNPRVLSAIRNGPLGRIALSYVEWSGPVGVITDLLGDLQLDANATYAIVCGPPVMFKFVCRKLNRMGIPMDRMFVSLERRMHCGMGKCCRCNVGATYTCTDGPVFDYWSVINLKEAI